MGIFTRMGDLSACVSRDLLQHGELGRGVVVSARQAGVDATGDHDAARVCVFTVEVALDGVPRYTATCRQAIRAMFLPQLMMPGAIVAVRVDAQDRERIALSLVEAPPS